MECYIHPVMDYLRVNQIISLQRAFTYDCIQRSSQSYIIQPGLKLFSQGRRLSSAMDIPGMGAAGWTSSRLFKGTTERDRNSLFVKLNSHLKTFTEKLRLTSVPKLIKQDVAMAEQLDAICSRIREGDYYRSKEMVVADLERLIEGLRSPVRQGAGEGELAVGASSASLEAADQLFKLINDHLAKEIGPLGSVGSGDV